MKAVVKQANETFLAAANEHQEKNNRLVNHELQYGFCGSRTKLDSSSPLFRLSILGKEKRQHTEGVKQLLQEEFDFATELQTKGLYPIGIVYLPLWNAICKKARLFNFSQLTPNGTTYAKCLSWLLYNLSFKGADTDSKHILLNASGTIGGLMVLTLSMYALIHSLLGANVLFALGGCIGLICFILLNVTPSFTTVVLYNLTPRSVLLKMLWPQKIDYPLALTKYDDFEMYMPVAVRFPTAPPEFIVAIVACEAAGFHPMFAIEQGAIVLSRRDIAQAALKNIHDMKERARERIRELEQWRRDPILYITKGNFVAVMCQYGNFAEEKKVVEWVKANGAKYCFN